MYSRTSFGTATPSRSPLEAEDRRSGFDIRQRDIGDQTALEARAQPVVERLDRLRVTIGGNHDLLARLIELVEGVEELLLGALLAGDELDVVDHQNVDRAVARPELVGLLAHDRLDQLVGEALRRDVEHLEPVVCRQRPVADGVQEVSLAQPHTPVEEERVEGARRRVGDGHRGGMGQPVRAADDEGFEGIAGVQAVP